MYLKEGSQPVVSDLKVVRKHVPGVFSTYLSNNEIPLKHDPDRIAEAVLAIASLGRVSAADVGGKKKSNGYHTVAVGSDGTLVIDQTAQVG
ncbi:MAG: hypothetical protein ACE5Q6_23495 [Dehalococcoidia bacterium]